ncbi:YggS family pyridoxal phosphate-dependent enzyme [Sulfobacillus harzensis]|uniref:Pyridoxal phosphate homeostasis protein n=1 Tax=Sulfobacillus harzensis TaxID=2729629 RepID=A0A7Y0Q278_9FIRM|nr:YggS family pyridoxal phosphate-dependent enzyme [Sulfobacillus harzensis]NMP21631.1 YggS family pyridoxal phosphate-dependent enzyme [Sulfobacillus harzensis]
MSKTLIAERVAEIKEKLRELAPDRRVSLMAVTKYRTREEALAAVAAGVDILGENRIQEAVQKWGDEKPSVALHMIGHVQTNKVKYGINLFDSFDSVDSDRLAEMLNHRASGLVRVMIEVNVGRETSKSGLMPEETLPFLASFERWPKLQVTGLMTVLPARQENSVEESRRIRRHMQEMVDLWRMCRSEGFPWAPMTELSMGMTGDWEWAVEAGSTIIRLGTFLFGPRL